MQRFLIALVVTLVGVATSGFAQTPAARPRPIEQFAELPMISGPKLSPNGKLIAAQLATGGKLYLAVFPVGGGKRRYIAVGANDLNWWRWVNDEWLVVGIGSKAPVLGDEWYIRRAVGVRAEDGKVVPLMTREAAQNADDVIWVAGDGMPRILLSLQKSIFSDNAGFWPEVDEVDVSTGRSKKVLSPQDGVMTWIADGGGTVRMGIGRLNDGRDTRVLYRANAKDRFKTIIRAKTNRDSYVVPALFLRDPDKALALADDESGFTGLYEYDLTTLQLGKQLYASKGFDLAGFLPNAANDELVGVSFLDDAPRVQWIDPDLVKMQAEISDFVQGGGARILNFSRDRQLAIVEVGANNSPGAFYLYNRAAGTMSLLAFANSQIKSTRLHPVKTIRYTARDGLEIAAVLTLPRNRSTNLPLIVLPHGGPFARDTEDWDWWTQYLADRGYAVVQPNYRGSSGYGTPFTQRGEGQWGLAMQDDLTDAVVYLAKQGIADAKRVCIVGASYGGYAAMRATQRDPDVYRCAISYAGVSDLARLRRYDSRFLSSGARMDWLKLQATDFRSVSPITSPAKTAIPLLLIHGKEDNVVPIAQSREMAERLRAAGRPVTYIEQPLADHHFSRAEDRLQFLRAMQDFLDKHNPA